MGPGRLQEESRHVRRLELGRAPVGRVPARHRDLDRRDVRAADERREVREPFLAEQADVDVDAVERPERADRIRSVLEHARRPRRARRLEELRQRVARRNELVELPVVQAAAGQRLLAPLLRQAHARPEQVDRVHRARVVDVVARDERSVERSGPRRVEQLEEEALRVGVALPVEDAIDPEILPADGRREVRPARVLGIGGRADGIRADVAEPARHADPVRLDEIAGLVVLRVAVVALGIPLLAGVLVEGRVREQAQPDDPGGLTVVRPDRHRLAARANLDARVLRRVRERVRRARGIAHVEPQAVAVGIGAGRLPEARLVDEPEVLEPVVAVVPLRVGHRRVRGHRLEEVERAEAGCRDRVPEAIVAAGPHDPHVPAHHLFTIEGDAAVHVVEVVFVGRRHRLRRPAGAHRLVFLLARLELVAPAGER